ncbi:MAG: serine/threonine protein kinase [Elusimicrobia bacterium]|nr:serine/threonine protein kinase [Elusimicrobiota bacterium]
MTEYQLIGNHYLLLRELGAGSFATVYKAWDRRLLKYVAVKKIHPHFLKIVREKDIFENFRNEAVNTAKLDNENIVKAFNFINDGSDWYLIMDYVKGVTLQYLLDKATSQGRTLPYELAFFILLDVMEALKYAHFYQGDLFGSPISFIHRDISPDNIMVYYDGRIKLADFGVAKAGASDESLFTGKLTYISPEQATGQFVGPQTDLFSSGLVLYEMLTGDKAYKGDIHTILRKARWARVPKKKLKELELPENFSLIISNLLERKTEKRYARASEVIRDISTELDLYNEEAALKAELKKFVDEVLKEEIEAEEEEMAEYSKIDFATVKTVDTSSAPILAPAEKDEDTLMNYDLSTYWVKRDPVKLLIKYGLILIAIIIGVIIITGF